MYIRGGQSQIKDSIQKAYVALTVTPVLEYEADGTTPKLVAPDRKYTLEVPIYIGEEEGTGTLNVTVIDESRSDV
jgi:hypothetical protein